MMPKKYILDFEIVKAEHLHELYMLFVLKPSGGHAMPEIHPGQFVQVAIDNKATFLRRPISVNFVDYDRNELWLLVRKAGDGTASMMRKKTGDKMNLVLPLGNGFTLPESGKRVLLVGGGVGIAPMLYWGATLQNAGIVPVFLIGARSAKDVLEFDEFQKFGEVHVSTEDGTLGQKGLVTTNTILSQPWDIIYCCGPAPMMKVVAKVAATIGAQCEVSLENMMACGLGACLCCVEKTVKGNVCVCTEGPIFKTTQLTWPI